jgi:chitinase
MKNLKFIILLFLGLYSINSNAQKNKNFSVIAYYTADDKLINEFEINKLTHIIYSFCHLKEGKLNVDNAQEIIE